MASKYLQQLTLPLAFVCLASACSSQTSDSDQSASTTAASPAPKVSRQFTATDVRVQLTQAGALSLDPTGTLLKVPVAIDNQGKVDLSSSDHPQVNIGAHLLDLSGAVVEQDLVHASLGDIHAGSKAIVVVNVPVKQLAEHYVDIIPIQEGVAWFDALGTTPLKLGPFKFCPTPDGAQTICGSDGVVIPKS